MTQHIVSIAKHRTMGQVEEVGGIIQFLVCSFVNLGNRLLIMFVAMQFFIILYILVLRQIKICFVQTFTYFLLEFRFLFIFSLFYSCLSQGNR